MGYFPFSPILINHFLSQWLHRRTLLIPSQQEFVQLVHYPSHRPTFFSFRFYCQKEKFKSALKIISGKDIAHPLRNVSKSNLHMNTNRGSVSTMFEFQIFSTDADTKKKIAVWLIKGKRKDKIEEASISWKQFRERKGIFFFNSTSLRGPYFQSFII